MNVRTALLRMGYESFLRPVLFRRHGGDPEAIHEELIRLLGHVSPWQRSVLRGIVGPPSIPVTVAGISFPGRVGVAARLDKDGVAASAWAALGFGFAELGTVTAFPQPGNDAPRLFRLRRSQAIVNRMGFNNRGAAALAARLDEAGVRRGQASLGIPLGISLGKSKVIPLADAVSDYVASFRAVAPYADYVAVNVSSPNTPGLRSLQDGGLLRDLVGTLVTEAASIEGPPSVPIFVKIAPDLTDAQIDEVLTVVSDAGASGLIATNTTLSRDGLDLADRPRADEAGGLSGAPLTRRALDVVTRVAGSTSLPVIGVGGIMTPGDADRMFDAGASLVQVYTGFIYHGVALVTGINARNEKRPR